MHSRNVSRFPPKSKEINFCRQPGKTHAALTAIREKKEWGALNVLFSLVRLCVCVCVCVCVYEEERERESEETERDFKVRYRESKSKTNA